MRENAFCMVFHARWISHHSSPNPTLVATRLGRDSETRGEKIPSHMENHTKCISCFTTTFLRAHSWLNWVDEDDEEHEVGLKEKPEDTRYIKNSRPTSK